ncbi:MAG: glycerol-3-phosphate 1-O-acyltransferase PlsY [Chloroflexi bacterium]|nr:glycerol-3-phosphate 1-O-acyltransferase PlsY [Chloroflexota bacterium]
MILDIVIVVLIGYLLGSIPFGLIIGKLVRGIDIREYGSGNIGFTNVLRNVGVKAGAVTLVCDIGKGAIPALLAIIIVGDSTAEIGSITIDDQGAQVIAAIAAVIGHNWSIYLRFRGGKGVDTTLGGLIAMSPLVGLACLIIGVAIIAITRYVSVGSMLGGMIGVVILTPLVITDHEPVEYLIYAVIVALLILVRHRDNIQNLRAGTERKIGRKGEKR